MRFEPDERLVKLIRAGHDGAFEVLFNRYNSRLLAFCTSMVKSRQDAEDVLQEVFASAHAAMLRDDRPINVRPWLYRIARNRCLNHLRKPVPEGQDSMDIHPHQNGTTTAEEVQHREELRQVLADVRTLPETQRTALLLREIDQLSYEEIAQAMDTTVPSIKSLLVRARIGLAESSQARLLTCGEVQVELAEAAEGIAKASGPARKHVRSCESCQEFRNQMRADRKALAALFPIGPFALLKGGFLAKIFGGGSSAGGAGAGAGAAGTAGAGAAGAGAGAAGAAGAGAGAAVGGASAAGGFSSGMGVLGSALGAKAAAGVATAALITAGAVEVRNIGNRGADSQATRDVPATVVTPSADRNSAERRQVTPFHAATVTPPPVEATPDAAPAAASGQQAPPVTEPTQPPAATGSEDGGTGPVAPTPGAEISGVGQVPTAVTPGGAQNPGSAVQPPTTTVPVAPPTSPPPTTGPPPTAEPPPTTGPPPVEPPAPVTPAPEPTTPPAPVA